MQDLWLDINVEFVVLGVWTNIAHEILGNVVYEQEEFDYLPNYNNLWLPHCLLNNLGCPYSNWVENSGSQVLQALAHEHAQYYPDAALLHVRPLPLLHHRHSSSILLLPDLQLRQCSATEASNETLPHKSNAFSYLRQKAF